MKNFEKQLNSLDRKRNKLDNKIAHTQVKIEKLGAKQERKQELMFAKFAKKVGVDVSIVKERYAQLKAQKELQILDEKVSRKLIK